MQQDFVAKMKDQLLAEKEELETRLRNFETDALGEPVREATGELSSYDNHPADLGSEMFERSKDFSLKQSTQVQVAKVNDALSKIEAGTYGTCDNCGKDINLERLEAMPATTMCIDCKSAEEFLPDRHPRPIEEDVIAPPWAGKTHDDSPRELGDAEDMNIFDGEDMWQQLAPYSEHAPDADAGSYYGGMDYDEDRGYVEDVDHLAYEKGEDGMFYALTPDNEIPDNIVEQDELPAWEEDSYQEEFSTEKHRYEDY